MKWISLFGLSLPLAIAALPAIAPARAQFVCPHARLRLETEQPVDAEAICAAAEPWAEQGIEVLVFLTDTSADSEDEWFALLDEVEIAAGILAPDQPDLGKANAFGVLASTDTGRPWGLNFSIGANLEATPLASQPAAIDQIKTQITNQFASEQYTEGTVIALTETFELAYPEVATAEAAPAEAEPEPEPEPNPDAAADVGSDRGGGLPWQQWLLWGTGSLVAVGGGGVGATMVAGQRLLKQRLKRLQTNVANLLMACDQLLSGDRPEDALLYQTFELAGGTRYPELIDAATSWIAECQAALARAFALNRQLLDDDTQAERSLSKRLKDWETLYVTLVGNSDRILALTEDQLHALLDPVGSLDSRSLQSSGLAAQISQVQTELAEKPLKVELQKVDPATVDSQGVLGYIDQVKGQVARLQAAQAEAPDVLADLRAERQAIARDVPDDFLLSADEMLAGIDRELAAAAEQIEAQLALRALEQLETIDEHLETVPEFIELHAELHQRQNAIDEMTERGYRPPGLARDRQEIGADINAIQTAFREGDYAAADAALAELDQDSQRALDDTQAWQTRHGRNIERLDELHVELQRLEELASQAQQAWAALQTYPADNWGAAESAIAEVERQLARVREEHLPNATRLNDLEVQDLPQVEAQLLEAGSRLEQAASQCQIVTNRYAEVQAIAGEVGELLRQTERELAELTALRDREDAKLAPELDDQIAHLRQRWQNAQAAVTERQFTQATQTLTAVREAIASASASAQDQIDTLDKLLEQRQQAREDAEREGDRVQQEVQQLSEVVLTLHLQELAQNARQELTRARQQQAGRNLADRDWTAALRREIAAYEEAEQAAAQALTKIRRERSDYERCLKEARQAVEQAESAIAAAERDTSKSDARGAGRSALQRAQRLLPDRAPQEGMSRQALAEIERQATSAYSAAREAERQAEHQLREAREARERSVPPASTIAPPASSSSSSSSSSNSSSSSSSSRRCSSRSQTAASQTEKPRSRRTSSLSKRRRL